MYLLQDVFTIHVHSMVIMMHDKGDIMS